MREKEPVPFDEEAEKKIKDLGWVEEDPSADEEDKISEMMKQITDNKALLREVKEKMEEDGEEDFGKVLREYAEEKVKQHEEKKESFEGKYIDAEDIPENQ